MKKNLSYLLLRHATSKCQNPRLDATLGMELPRRKRWIDERLLLGLPGQRRWRQWGRAGRPSRHSLVRWKVVRM
uniref:Uncharacterized protein n=1 Tax=Arundo donax TaxID=35708 RepID=A0A0A9EQH4_ARUDO